MVELEEVHEPFSTTEVIAEGIADIFRTEDMVHMTFWSYQKIPGLKGIHRVCTGKLAITVSGLSASRSGILRALAEAAATGVSEIPEQKVVAH